MKLYQIFYETPFTDKQEDRFLSSLKQEIKKRDDHWPSPIKITKLVKQASPKAKKIGAGAYSAAYGRQRSNVVVKITTDGDGDATLEFLRWAKQRQNNPHLPKVFSIKKIHSKEEGRSAFDEDIVKQVQAYVRMERLVPLITRKYKWKPEHVPFLEYLSNEGYFENVYTMDIIGSEAKWTALQQEAKRKKIKTSKLLQTFRTLEKRHGILDVALSTVGHNIMVRPSTGEIVIHDPA